MKFDNCWLEQIGSRVNGTEKLRLLVVGRCPLLGCGGEVKLSFVEPTNGKSIEESDILGRLCSTKHLRKVVRCKKCGVQSNLPDRARGVVRSLVREYAEKYLDEVPA